jgi:hypothetical protein
VRPRSPKVPDVSVALPDPPESLGGAPRAFYGELRRVLAVVQPAQLDPRQSSAHFQADGVELELTHGDRTEWSIWCPGDSE